MNKCNWNWNANKNKFIRKKNQKNTKKKKKSHHISAVYHFMKMERKPSFRRRQHIKKPFSERAKEHCRQFTAFLFSNVGIIILVVVYMIGGKWNYNVLSSFSSFSTCSYPKIELKIDCFNVFLIVFCNKFVMKKTIQNRNRKKKNIWN